MLSCTESKVIEKERINCPTCKRDYALYKSTHVCNPVVQCKFNNKVKYSEEYHKDRFVSPATLICECNSCEEATAAKTTPQKNMCPKCEYVGWYVTDETKLCPVCKAPPVQKPKPKKPAPVNNDDPWAWMITSPPVVFSTLRLYCAAEIVPLEEVGATLPGEIRDPTTHKCIAISINGVNPSHVLESKWVTERWRSAINSDDETSCRTVMSSLNDFIEDLRSKYILQWCADGDVKFWIWHLFNKFGPDNKKELNITL